MELQQIIDKSHRIVFFGGAGVSTESGIPIFGRWMDFIIRNMIIPLSRYSATRFLCGTQRHFYDFYRDKMLCLTAKA